MKNKLLSFCLIISLTISFSSISYADEEKEVVEPNVYEKREINLKQNRDNRMERKKLPEEQMDLTFDKNEATKNEQLLDELFQTSMIETNTITSKAAQMELFSSMDEEWKREEAEEETVSEGSNLLMILMISAVLIIVAMIFIIIPKLQQTQN